MRRARLNEIEIRDFRGFREDLVPPIRLEGKSLLLYGENGSGKSTIGEALRQLLDRTEKQSFNSDFSDIHCLKNRFSDEDSKTGLVRLTFTPPESGEVKDMEWRIDCRRPVDHAYFPAMARTRSFLGYRDILRTHFLHYEEEGINLFNLIVETLLRDVQYPTVLLTFGGEWEAIRSDVKKWRVQAARDPETIDEFERAQLLLPGTDPDELEEGEGETPFAEAYDAHVERERQSLVSRVTAFNQALITRLDAVTELANGFLHDGGFDPHLKLDLWLKTPVPTLEAPDAASWPGTPELLLRAVFREKELDHPGVFLNEARLTAIALALYFAALKDWVPEKDSGTEPRLLVLDDVLIGLDMAHRLPVLKVIQQEFAERDWQVILMTFDRTWYHVAKQRVGDEWKMYELFAVSIGDDETPLLVPSRKENEKVALVEDEGHLIRALSFLARGEIKAAAAHTRTRFEEVLKNACARRRLKVEYQDTLEKVTASDLWGPVAADKSALKRPAVRPPSRERRGRETPPNRGPVLARDPLSQPVVPPELAVRVQHALSWVLNPLSHSQVIDHYRSEVEDAVYAVDELQRAVDTAIQREKDDARLDADTVVRGLLLILYCRWLQLGGSWSGGGHD